MLLMMELAAATTARMTTISFPDPNLDGLNVSKGDEISNFNAKAKTAMI